jgi:hypothetical protein
MAIPTTNNIKKNPIAQIIEFFKGNPILSVIASLMFLAVIMPPRTRKYKRKSKARRKRFGNPGNPGKKKRVRKTRKTKSRKKLPRSVGTATKTKSGKRIPRSSGKRMPEKFKGAKKGTALMTEKMNWLRSLK